MESLKYWWTDIYDSSGDLTLCDGDNGGSADGVLGYGPFVFLSHLPLL